MIVTELLLLLLVMFRNGNLSPGLKHGNDGRWISLLKSVQYPHARGDIVLLLLRSEDRGFNDDAEDDDANDFLKDDNAGSGSFEALWSSSSFVV